MHWHYLKSSFLVTSARALMGSDGSTVTTLLSSKIWKKNSIFILLIHSCKVIKIVICLNLHASSQRRWGGAGLQKVTETLRTEEPLWHWSIIKQIQHYQAVKEDRSRCYIANKSTGSSLVFLFMLHWHWPACLELIVFLTLISWVWV